MADVILTLEQLIDVFWEQTTIMLCLDPNNPDNSSRVRKSWQPVGAPTWERIEDVAFIRINSDVNDPITQQRSVTYSPIDVDNTNRSVSYTRVHTVQWVLYGESSWDDADKIRSSLYTQDIKDNFKRNNLFMILDVQCPRRAEEQFQGQNWRRTDFTARFNELVIRENLTPLIKTVEHVTHYDT